MNIFRNIDKIFRKPLIFFILISTIASGLPINVFLKYLSERNVVDNRYRNLPSAKKFEDLGVKKAIAATSQFSPSSSSLVLGTPLANSATNVGSWRGTLASDNIFWSVLGTTTGFDMQLNLANVSLNGANKLILTAESANVTTARAYFIQICDWVSSAGVNNAADANCTGGGWRTVNNPKATAYTNTADAVYTFEIFDGYFYSGTTPGARISTPLANFVSLNNFKMRFFSTVNSTAQFNADRVQLEAAVDPVYRPDSYNPIAPFAGATANFYTDTFGSNNIRQSATNTAANPLNFYYSFKNIQTYTGANAILVVYEGGYVSATTLTYNLAIYNFSSSSWETLNAAPITASAASTDQLNYFAKSGVALADYISGGESRIRVFSTVSGTQTFQTDMIYITIGSVNNDAAKSEVSFGQATATNSLATADLAALTTATVGNTWTQTSCLNNTAPCAAAPYPADWAGTWGTNYSSSANVSVPITIPANAMVTGIRYAARFRSNITTNTVQLGLKDFSGQFVGQTIAGGWTGVGATNALATFTFTDGIYQINPEDFIDTVNNVGNLRLRTSASTATAAATRDWDFAMMSVRWVNEPAGRKTILSQFSPSSSSLVLGTPLANSATNVGSWRGTLASDNIFWSVLGTTTGFDMQLNLANVSLNGANKLILTAESANVTTARAYFIQICDWVSSAGVNNAADANCTGGGWRTVNNPKATAYTNTADAVYTFEIFDGYFYSGTTPGARISTPLANFVSLNNFKMRFFSTVNSTAQFNADRVQLEAAVDPVYRPDSYNPIAPFAGATANFYTDTFGSNNIRQSATNTAANPLNFYYSFKNIQTYTGANAILVVYEGGYVSATTLTYNLAIYNFSSSSWETLNAAPITASAASTDQLNYFAKSGVALADYISGGESRIRVFSTVSGTQTFQTDMIYITIGSVNNDAAKSEVSFGQATATNSLATADLAALTTATVGNTWTQTSCLNNTAPCAAAPYPADWAGTWGTNYSSSANVSVPITIPANAMVTGIRYAARFRSNITTNTVQLGLKDFSGQFVGQTIAGGWTGVGATNALATFTFTDGIYQINPEDFIDTVNNVGNLRLRTSASTATAAATRDWDFAMMSVRWASSASAGRVKGYVISSTIDTGVVNGAAFNSLMWKGNLNNGKVQMQLATANCAGGQSDYPVCSIGSWGDSNTPFRGTDCSSSTSFELLSDTPAEIMCAADHNNKRYFRYKITLCSNDCITSGPNNPEVTDVIVNWAP